MNRFVLTWTLTVIATAGCTVFCSETAFAIAPFKKQFFETYVKEDPSSPTETTLAEAANAKTGKCYVCHVNMTTKGESGLGKKIRNNYGRALSQFLEKKNFSSERRKAEPDAVKAEIQAALKKVAEIKSDPSNPDSPTFGELIAAGKLPGNDIPDADDLARAIKERDEEEE